MVKGLSWTPQIHRFRDFKKTPKDSTYYKPLLFWFSHCHGILVRKRERKLGVRKKKGSEGLRRGNKNQSWEAPMEKKEEQQWHASSLNCFNALSRATQSVIVLCLFQCITTWWKLFFSIPFVCHLVFYQNLLIWRMAVCFFQILFLGPEADDGRPWEVMFDLQCS